MELSSTKPSNIQSRGALVTKLLRLLRDSNLSGEFLAAFLFISARYTIWPIYLWVRSEWILLKGPNVLLWCICTFLFAFFAWLLMFLSNEFERYPGINTDALLGGLLWAVAAALHYADEISGFSNKGVRGAAWIVFLATSAILYRNFICRSTKALRPDRLSNISSAAESSVRE